MKKLTSLLILVACGFVLPTVFAQGLQVAEAKLGKGVQDRNITEEATTFAVNDKEPDERRDDTGGDLLTEFRN